MRNLSCFTLAWLMVLGGFCAVQAQTPARQKTPNPSALNSSQHVLAGSSCRHMGLTLTLPGYAVISGGNERQPLKTGDILGIERYKVVAVQEEQIFLETPIGFARIERLENGSTEFRHVRPAEIPLELRHAFAMAADTK